MADYDDNTIENTVKYIFETGSLSKYKKAGWWLLGIKDPQSVSDHGFRTAIITYVLSKMEGKENASDITVSALFHDVYLARFLDLHMLHRSYNKPGDDVKRKIQSDQLSRLPKEVSEDLDKLLFDDSSKIILRDANYLETAISAKEYLDIGHEDAQNWIDRVGEVLVTKNAKALFEKMQTMKSTSWWHGLKQNVGELKYGKD